MKRIARNLLIYPSLALFVLACEKEDDSTNPPVEPTPTYRITVGVYILDGGNYTDQNKDLVFDTQEGCQTWSRTAQADAHSSSAHFHFNAAKNTTYDSTSETIAWMEYGPELDQPSIDATCDAGNNGAPKTANKTDYTADKNFFLQIKSVEEL
jgi:hypothetical protein